MSAAQWDIVILTLQVAILALAVSLPLAIIMGYILARKRFIGYSFVNAIIHLPLVMPPVVTGYLLLLVLGRQGSIGRLLYDTFGLTLAFRWTGAAIAAAVMAFPLMVRPIRLAIEMIDEGLEQAAETLGANRFMVFVTIILPLALPGIIAAAILGFAKAMGEFGATITFVANIPGETQTLALAIHTFLQNPDGEKAALHLMMIAIGISLLALLLSEIIVRQLAAKWQGRIL